MRLACFTRNKSETNYWAVRFETPRERTVAGPPEIRLPNKNSFPIQSAARADSSAHRSFAQQIGENNLSTTAREHPDDFGGDTFADQRPGIVDDDHCAVG